MRCLALLLLLCPAYAYAQVAPVDSSQPVAVVPPTAWPTSRVCLLVDRSGSMGGPELERAIRAASYIVGMPVDELQIRLTVFDEAHSVWAGHRYPWDKDTPPGWTVFPDRVAHSLAMQWLASHPAAGGTDPTSALRDALVQPISGLTVVLISDGIFDDTQKLSDELRSLQTWRVKQGLGPAIVATYGIGSGAKGRVVMRRIGTEFRGGFYVDPRQQRSGL